jgi:hypothetical protein
MMTHSALHKERSVVNMLFLSAALLFGCAGAGSRTTASSVIGEWEKQEQTLPPINLSITGDSSALRARLRLSGTERFGTATLDGSNLLLKFDRDTQQVRAELRSPTEMRIVFGVNGLSFVLRKQSR